MPSFRSQPPAFGLDLADSSVKIVQLEKRGRSVGVDVVTAADLPPGLLAAGLIKDGPALTDALQKILLPLRKVLAPGVILSLPESQTFAQTITVSKKPPVGLPEQLAATLPEHLPTPLAEVYEDDAIISETPGDWTVAVGAAPKTLVDSYLALVESLDLVPMAFDVQAAAIVRALLPGSERPAASRAIIDLGRNRASLLVHDRGSIQFTVSLPIAGDAITHEIERAMNVPFEQAEATKVTCGLDPARCNDSLRTVLQAMVANLEKHVREAREFYQDHYPGAADITEIVLCGGGAHLAMLDQVLATSLGLPVRLGRVLLQDEPKRTVPSPLQYTTAVGLALRGLTAAA